MKYFILFSFTDTTPAGPLLTVLRRKCERKMRNLKITINQLQEHHEEILHEAATKAIGKRRVRVHRENLKTQVNIGIKHVKWIVVGTNEKLNDIEEWFKPENIHRKQ